MKHAACVTAMLMILLAASVSAISSSCSPLSGDVLPAAPSHRSGEGFPYFDSSVGVLRVVTASSTIASLQSNDTFLVEVTSESLTTGSDANVTWARNSATKLTDGIAGADHSPSVGVSDVTQTVFLAWTRLLPTGQSLLMLSARGAGTNSSSWDCSKASVFGPSAQPAAEVKLSDAALSRDATAIAWLGAASHPSPGPFRVFVAPFGFQSATLPPQVKPTSTACVDCNFAPETPSRYAASDSQDPFVLHNHWCNATYVIWVNSGKVWYSATTGRLISGAYAEFSPPQALAVPSADVSSPMISELSLINCWQAGQLRVCRALLVWTEVSLSNTASAPKYAHVLLRSASPAEAHSSPSITPPSESCTIGSGGSSSASHPKAVLIGHPQTRFSTLLTWASRDQFNSTKVDFAVLTLQN